MPSCMWFTNNTWIEGRHRWLTPQAMGGGGGALYAPLWFFALYSKNHQATQTWKFLTFPNFLLRIPIWKKNPKILFYPRTEHFWDTKYKNIWNFWFNKKNLLTNPSWNFATVCPIADHKLPVEQGMMECRAQPQLQVDVSHTRPVYHKEGCHY